MSAFFGRSTVGLVGGDDDAGTDDDDAGTDDDDDAEAAGPAGFALGVDFAAGGCVVET